MECFTADFLRFFAEKRQNLAFGWTAGYSPSKPNVSFFSCVGMKARPAAKMPRAYLFCKNEYNTVGFLYTIKYTKKMKF